MSLVLELLSFHGFVFENYHWGSLSTARLREYKNADASTDLMARTSARRDVFGSLVSKLT